MLDGVTLFSYSLPAEQDEVPLTCLGQSVRSSSRMAVMDSPSAFLYCDSLRTLYR